MTIISITVTAQSVDCRRFNGIGSSKSDKLSLTIGFSNGTTLSVCRYEQEKLSENEGLISEFNVFNCKTGEQLVEYGAVQNGILIKDELELKIVELKLLPAGENWKWEEVKIGLQKIFVKGNKLIVLDEKPAFAQTKTNKTKAYSHLRQPKKMKGTGKLENPEEILSRLEFLALNDFNEVVDILYDFENYFDYQTDGAITEQWKDAVATVKWITE